jgi:C-terminal processing protease CtpA/Prc
MKGPALTAFLVLVLDLSVGQQAFVTGITLVGGAGSCPVFVANVGAGTPAEHAGVRPGDVLVKVNGTHVETVHGAAKLLHSDAEKPVTLELIGSDGPYTATVQRERQSKLLQKQGYKLLSSGMIVSLDATETEMDDKMHALTQDRFVDRVFPTHYPSDEKRYYPGFEALVLKNPSQVAVLGIEDGPASRAGVHWGDIILSVNGVDPRNKSTTDLEKLFSSEKSARMILKIQRVGTRKTFKFELAQAAKVLRDNQRRLVQGRLVPIGVPERYLSCFR